MGPGDANPTATESEAVRFRLSGDFVVSGDEMDATIMI